MPGRYTPQLQASMTRLGSKLSFAEACEEVWYSHKTQVAETTLRRVKVRAYGIEAGPAYYMLDASARVEVGRYALTVRGGNIGDSQRFGSGSVSGDGTVRYFVLPARALFVTGEVGW